MLFNRLNAKCQLKPLLRKQKMKRILLFVLVLLGIAQVVNGQVSANWIDLYKPHADDEMPLPSHEAYAFQLKQALPAYCLIAWRRRQRDG